MINAKTAAAKAIDYLKDFYNDASNVQVEEVELSDDQKWLITLGYFDPQKDNPFSFSFGERKYKLLTVDQDGIVKSMKIRSVE